MVKAFLPSHFPPQPDLFPPHETSHRGVFFSQQDGYLVDMNIIPEIHKKKLILVCAPHAARDQISALSAQLALRSAITILDGGNLFPAYQTIRMLRKLTLDITTAANRIFIRRAFTCYQMLELLESTPTLPQPYIVLDLLATFYDENVPVPEIHRLLDRSLAQLDRLKLMAPIIVTLAPSHPERVLICEKVRAHADQVIDIDVPFPIMIQPPLF
jgi:hypothetical protein